MKIFKGVDHLNTGVWLEARPCLKDGEEWVLGLMDGYAKGLDKAVKFAVHRVTDHSDYHIGNFSFAPMPGCCGVVVSFYSVLHGENKGKGHGQPFHKLKEQVAKELGYSSMIATVEARNLPQIISASRERWKMLEPFRNKRTGNDLFYMIKNLER